MKSTCQTGDDTLNRLALLPANTLLMDQFLTPREPAIESWLSAVSNWLEHSDEFPIETDATVQYHHNSSPTSLDRHRPITPCSVSSRSKNLSRKRKRTMSGSDATSVRSDATATTRTTSLSFHEQSILPQPIARPHRARSSSPIRKTLFDLRLAKPSVKAVQPDRSIVQPQAVVELRSRLINRLSRAYVPLSLRERFQNVDPDQFEAYEHLFERENPTLSQLEIDAQWQQVEKIYGKAQMGHDRPLDESYWVKLVSDILESVVDEPTSMLQLYLIQTQKINQAFLPLHDGQPITKQVDLALGFDSQNGCIGDFILRTNKAYPTTPLSQMSDANTMMIPLACGVEVKESGGNYNEAISQLGVWCAAGLERLKGLRQLAHRRAGNINNDNQTVAEEDYGIEHEENDLTTLPPLIGWTIVGHDWRLHISWKDSSGDVVILGPWRHLTTGTGSHMEIWTLLTLIQEIRRWLEEVYWEWLRKNVLEHLV